MIQEYDGLVGKCNQFGHTILKFRRLAQPLVVVPKRDNPAGYDKDRPKQCLQNNLQNKKEVGSMLVVTNSYRTRL